MDFELRSGRWLNEPSHYEITANSVMITTEPRTDFWQRSYYGFRNGNAPALLFTSGANFSFSMNVKVDYQEQFDQSGPIVFIDNENWFKASIEFENEAYSRLGSVVTNYGYSDWATTDISLPTEIWYRLSRRGPDFLIEHSLDGKSFHQMRVFHMHLLEETTQEMGEADPPVPAKGEIEFGMYACSPSDSSFTARFTEFSLEPSRWSAHRPA